MLTALAQSIVSVHISSMNFFVYKMRCVSTLPFHLLRQAALQINF